MRAIAVVMLLAAGLGAGCGESAESAESNSEWPQRAVRLIVPIGVGGAVDLAARVFANKLAERWGQPVVVENRPGGDGVTGFTAFAAADDEHALLFTPSGLFLTTAVVHDSLPYDPIRDFAPISFAGRTTVVIAASRELPVSSLAQLVELIRGQERRYHWSASPGPPDLYFASFLSSRKLSPARVSYSEIAEATRDLGEGRLDVLVTALASVGPQLEAGKIRLLAVTDESRSSAVPEVPTVAEAGYPELTYKSGGYGVFGWRDMPDALRQRIAADVEQVMADPEVRDRLVKMGVTPVGGSPQEFAAALEQLRTRLAEVARGEPPRSTD